MEAIKEIGVRGLNHLIRCESWAKERLHKLSGAHLRVDAGVFGVRLGIDQSGLFQLVGDECSPDVTLTLPPDFVVRVLFDRSKLFSAVKLEGSVDVAESLAFVFRNLRWDAEADLARIIGDIAAHRLVHIGHSLAAALGNGMRNTALNIQEYVVEESEILASARELDSFGAAVGRLTDELASLEKRLAKL